MPFAGRRGAIQLGVLACGLGAALQGPALFGAFFDDDYAQLAYLDGLPHPGFFARNALDLYDFGDVVFCRPLSSALMALDWALFRTALTPYHVHSMLWFVAVIAIAAALLRRVVPSIATPATLLFATSRAACTTVVWWCNRHLLVTAVFGLLAVLFHVRAREDGDRRAGIVSLVALALALAGGESGLQAVSFLAAYELTGASGSIASRLRAFAPPFVLALAYLVVRRALGFGVRNGMWFYFDPLSDPARFAAAAIDRLPGFGAIVLGGGTEIISGKLASIVALALLAVIALSIVRPSARHPGVRWLLVGGLLSVPISLASPQPNVRIFPILAATIAVAVLVDAAARAARTAAVAAVLVGIYGLLSPWVAFSDARRQAALQRDAHVAIARAPIHPDEEEAFVLSGSPLLWQGLRELAVFRRDLKLTRWTTIPLDERGLRVTRVAPFSVVVESTTGAPVTDAPFGKAPIGEAQRLDAPGVTATALEGAPGTRLRLDFPTSSRACVLAYERDHFVRVE